MELDGVNMHHTACASKWLNMLNNAEHNKKSEIYEIYYENHWKENHETHLTGVGKVKR